MRLREKRRCYREGIILMFATLWGGSYLMSSLPDGNWAHAPLFVTTVVLFMAGAARIAYGITEGK